MEDASPAPPEASLGETQATNIANAYGATQPLSTKPKKRKKKRDGLPKGPKFEPARGTRSLLGPNQPRSRMR